jgi:hypothetical protein
MTTSLYTGNTCVTCGHLLKHDDTRTTMPNHCVFCRRDADRQEASDSRKPSPFFARINQGISHQRPRPEP